MVFCHGILSNSKTLSNGIPQGSVLGPILFLLFINDIAQSLKTCTCNMFADDVVIYTSHKNIDELTILLQNDVHSIHRWYTQNNLKVNAEKTKIMLLSTRKAYNLNIYMDGTKMEQVHNFKYLGVEIDEHLTWDIHVKRLTRLISMKLFSLRNMSQYLDVKSLKLMYNTIILPCIDYSCTVWGNCSRQNKELLLRLQKRAARIITSNYDYENVRGDDLIKLMKWQSFDERRNYFLAVLMYKSVHGIAPTHLCNAIEMVCDRHNLNTRAADKTNVILPKPNLECFKNSLMYSGGVIWNSLPINLQHSTSISSFKYLYKSLYFH